MSQQSSPIDASKVMRNLKIHECTINGLFDLSCLPSKIIKEKLTELTDLIADIPDSLGEAVFDEWNLKLARWWAQYAEWMSKGKQNEPTQVSVSNNSNSGSVVADFGEQQKKITILSDSRLGNLNRNAIKYRIELEFSVLPAVASPTDIEGMKCLLLQISQSLKHFAFDGKINNNNHNKKFIFYCDVFSVAFAKLSTELCEHYLQVTQSANSPLTRLDGLRQFIANQIVKIYNQNSGLCAENSIDTIGEQMKLEFCKLPKVDNENCIDQVQCIHTCVSKARALLHPFRFNVSFNKLQSNLFDLAFSTLSLDLQKKCAQVNPSNRVSKTLVSLIKILSKHMVDYYAKERTTQAAAHEQIPQEQLVVSEFASNDAKCCNYCRSVEHLSGQCDQLKWMTCFNCLQTGHDAKVCPAKGTNNTFCFECVQFGHLSGYCPIND